MAKGCKTLLCAVVIIGGISAVALAAGASRLGFSAKDYRASGDYTYQVAVADFNRDGRSDLVTGSSDTEVGASETGVLLARPGCRFRRARALGLDGDGEVATADFNRDRNPDVVRVSASTDGQSAIWLGDGRGGFGKPKLLLRPPYGSYVAVGDLNRDRKPDLAIAGSGKADEDDPLSAAPPNGIWLLLGDGTGGFSAARRFAASAIRAAAIAGEPWGRHGGSVFAEANASAPCRLGAAGW